jgi:hypothetical protein
MVLPALSRGQALVWFMWLSLSRQCSFLSLVTSTFCPFSENLTVHSIPGSPCCPWRRHGRIFSWLSVKHLHLMWEVLVHLSPVTSSWGPGIRAKPSMRPAWSCLTTFKGRVKVLVHLHSLRETQYWQQLGNFRSLKSSLSKIEPLSFLPNSGCTHTFPISADVCLRS